MELTDRIQPALKGVDPALDRLLDQLATAFEAQRDALRGVAVWQALDDRIKSAPHQQATFSAATGHCRTVIRALEARLADLGRGLLPEGTLTFLMTDIKDSTSLWEHEGTVMAQALRLHDELTFREIERFGGRVVKPRGEGDSLFCVFGTASAAVEAAFALQQALLDQSWPTHAPLTLRIGLHSGEAALQDGDYRGVTVNVCARIRDAAAPSEIKCSEVSYHLASAHIQMRGDSLGPCKLKGLEEPVSLVLLRPRLRPPMRDAKLPARVERINSPWDRDWLLHSQQAALPCLQSVGFRDYMQVWMAPSNHRINRSQVELRDAARSISIHPATDMPITGVPPSGPIVTGDGLTMSCPDHELRIFHTWTFRCDGHLYLLQSLPEDSNTPGTLGIWERFTRVIELLQLAHRLYAQLGLSSDSRVRLGIHHVGLAGRTLIPDCWHQSIDESFKCTDDEHYAELEVPVDISTEGIDAITHARSVLSPLMMIFNCYQARDDIWEPMLSGYWAGATSFRRPHRWNWDDLPVP